VNRARRVLLVGCEGADWSNVNRLSAAGVLPNLHRLIEDGASGSLQAPPPPLTEMLWTSLATGYRARRHGVTSPLEQRLDGGGVQPVGRRSWRAAAFWEELAQDGLTTCVVNWPATWPAACWPGTMIDERFAKAAGKQFEDWPMPQDCVSPAHMRSALRALRVHPADISGDEIAVFAPNSPEIIPESDEHVIRIATLIAETATVHAVATHLMAESRWDLLVARYDLLAQAQIVFQRQGEATEPLAGLDAAYQFFDMMLGRVLKLCDETTDLIVVSPRSTAGPGVLVARGPTFARDRIVHGASIFDLAPTILALFGRASTAEQDGRVLDDLLLLPTVPQLLHATRAPQGVPGDGDVMHLRALGYSDAPTLAQRQAMREAELSSLLHLAESEVALGAHHDAVAAAERALAIAPESVPASLLLAHARVHLDEWEACEPIADLLLKRQPESPWGSLLKGAVLALRGDVQSAEPHLARARALGQEMPLAHLALGLLALRLRNVDDAGDHFRAALSRQPDLLPALRGLAMVLRARRELDTAESLLRQAITLRYIFPEAHYQLGLVLADQGRVAEATHELRTTLQQDPSLTGAETALQRVLQAQLASRKDTK
jgi:hypothetical protein